MKTIFAKETAVGRLTASNSIQQEQRQRGISLSVLMCTHLPKGVLTQAVLFALYPNPPFSPWKKYCRQSIFMKRFLFLPITEKQVILILLSPLSQNPAIKKPQSKTDSLCFDRWKAESASNFALLIMLKIKKKKRKQKMKIFSAMQKIKAAHFPNYLWTGGKNHEG